MKNKKSHFVFTKQERHGVFVLVSLILIAYGVYFCYEETANESLLMTPEEVLVFQQEIDSLAKQSIQEKARIKPFNPNFISDYKGYVLGMSIEEIDRLHAFRETGKYVNSATEFQEVTQVSDSLLDLMSKFFKFPEWVIQKNKASQVGNNYLSLELNRATVQSLVKQASISSQSAHRIVAFRKSLGGFVTLSQLEDVYRIDSEELTRVKEKFRLNEIPEIKKININLASVKEISSTGYISYSLAQAIVEERTLRDGFKSLEELKRVPGFPEGKFTHIKLYLTIIDK